MHNPLSVEDQILLTCSRGHFDAEAQVTVESLLDQPVNWEALAASAWDHHLLPLLYERLKTLDAAVPSPVMARLKSAYYTGLLRNQRLAAELTQVIAALRQAGVEVLVLKGAALSQTVYPNPAQRPMADLDLLVRPEGMDRMGEVLASLGFDLPGARSAPRLRFEQQFGGGVEWIRSIAGQTTRLDVQHDLVGWDWCRASFPVEPHALWAAAQPLALDGTPAWQLSAEDSLIHLCLHPALHHGYACPLISYVDIDRLVTAVGGALSWPRLIDRAGRFQVKTVVYCGLRRAQFLLGTPVPPEVLTALRPGRVQLRLLRWLVALPDRDAGWQDADEQLRGVREFLLYAALTDHIWAVGGMVRGLAFPGEEWLTVRYSLRTRQQARLYRPVHVLRLARSFLRGFHRPLGESSLD